MQILLTVWLLAVQQNLQNVISDREQKLRLYGRIQTGSYVNKDGVKVYTTDVIVDEQEFAESKSASQNGGYGASNGYQQGGYQQSAPAPTPSAAIGDGFMNIPDGIDEELPFS